MNRKNLQAENSLPVTYLISGRIQEEFVISPSGIAYNNFLGGNLTYAFAGLRYWDPSVGLISRVSPEFPKEKLIWFEEMGATTSGIVTTVIPFEQRRFYAIQNDGLIESEKPLAHYARVGAEYPKQLLGFSTGVPDQLIPHYEELRIPSSYLQSELALLCPEDLMSQTALTSFLQKGAVHDIILSPSSDFMHPQFQNEWFLIFKNLSVIFLSEKMIRTFFSEPQRSLWDLAEQLISFGVKTVIINLERLSYWILDQNAGKRWIVPTYPVQAQNPLGSDSAFLGGFLFGFHKLLDLLEGTLYGLVSASLMAGGITPLSIFDSLPGLAEARLENLRSAVKQI